MSSEHPEHGHESTDARVVPLLTFAAGLVVLALVVTYLSGRMLTYFADRSTERDRPVRWEAEAAPGPRLQVDPQRDLDELQAAQRARIASYRWLDRDAGIVQVPVELAIEMVLERGLPTRAPQNGGER